MEKLIKTYKRLIEERLNLKRLLHVGEDSIRYDFFAAILETYNFRPCQIQIEVAINSQTFVPRDTENSKRNENPLIDLIVNENELKISVEFGLFRQNSNDKGNIGNTGRTVKMLNDMIRVSLEAYFTGTKGLFICVADNKMLGHQLRSKILDPFPSNYMITNDVITHQLEQKTNNFDDRFLQVFNPLNRNIVSKLIFNEELHALQIQNETRLLIWEVAIEQ